MSLLAPTYYGMANNPESWWQDFEANWPADQPGSPFIVNPASGPGTSRDQTLDYNLYYQGLMNDDSWNGIGYIDMPLGFSTSTVVAEADSWRSNYGEIVSGFFFDDVARDQSGPTSSDLAQIEWAVYQIVSQYRPWFVVVNAAGSYTTTAGLFYCLKDVIDNLNDFRSGTQFLVVTVETSENRSTIQPPPQNDIMTRASDFASNGPLNWVYNYPPTYFAGLIHDGTSGNVQADLDRLATYNIGYSFVTDRSAYNNSNPWAPGPSDAVWSQLVSNTGPNVTYTYNVQPSVPPLNITCPPMAP